MTTQNPANRPRALIAMSGGVDSSVAACLMQQAGYDCTGITMRLTHNETLGQSGYQTCCSEKDIEDASEVAFQLDIPYEVLDFTLEQNMVLQRFQEPKFQKFGFIKQDAVRSYAEVLIDQYDVRSGQGPITVARSMSGGNQQKAIIAREVDRDKPLIVAVQPTRGLDVGAIEYIHSQLVAERDRGKAILLVSLELDEVMSLSDRILVLYEGEIVGELNPKKTNIQELGLYMAGAKRAEKGGGTE